VIAVSLVPLALSRVESPPDVGSPRFGLRRLTAISPLGVAGCFAAGVINGAFFAMGPVYAAAISDRADWIAIFMMVVIFSGLLLQFPIGHLSDLFDRRKVILGLSLALSAVCLTLGLFGQTSLWLLIALLALYGGTAYTLYPICLAHANDHMAPTELIPAAAGLLVCFGAGAALGPTLTAQVMAAIGEAGLFHASAAIALLLAGFTAYRMTRRPPVPNEEQAQFVAVLNTTSEATQLDPRAEPEEEDEMQLAFDFSAPAADPDLAPEAEPEAEPDPAAAPAAPGVPAETDGRA
jgi:MFS family permease